MSRNVLITCGLPYANGNAHFGHLLEYLQGDVYSRSRKLAGDNVVFLCASDTHGTPIEVKAREANTPPEEFVQRISKSQLEDFRAFDVAFDYFYTTHSVENQRRAEGIFAALKDAGHIHTKTIEQYYCESDKRFLPDRFIKGTCPSCKAADQYGDVCESCGSTYSPTDLGEPVCALCRKTPVRKSSLHYFFQLAAYTEKLREWVQDEKHLQPEVRNFVERWLGEGLQDWDISRDGPYFGFLIPGETDKYFYVWMDAPIGYISTTEKFCAETGRDFDAYWRQDAEIEHIIGKDIIYFHTLFWPAMLMGSGYTLPSKVIVHGMLTVNGTKMSKTRGTFINARTYLDHLDPQYLRYYFAAHMTPRVEDIDLNLVDFADRVDGELVNNIVNLASRSLQFAIDKLDARLGLVSEEAESLWQDAVQRAASVCAAYRARDFARAIREILAISSLGNLYLQEQAPWKVMKQDVEKARTIVTTAINVVKLVAILIKPVLPRYAEKIEKMLQTGSLSFADVSTKLEKTSLAPFERLMERVDRTAIAKILEASKPKQVEPVAEKKPIAPMLPEIAFDDFAKLDLRVGKILAAEAVPKTDKLLKLTVDLGETQPRTIVSGIAKAYKPEALVGRSVSVVANLGKKALRGIESHGMILAAGEPPSVLFVDDELAPGTKIS